MTGDGIMNKNIKKTIGMILLAAAGAVLISGCSGETTARQDANSGHKGSGDAGDKGSVTIIDDWGEF